MWNSSLLLSSDRSGPLLSELPQPAAVSPGGEESISCDGVIISQLAQAVSHSYTLTQKEGRGEQKCLAVVMIGVLVIF